MNDVGILVRVKRKYRFVYFSCLMPQWNPYQSKFKHAHDIVINCVSKLYELKYKTNLSSLTSLPAWSGLAKSARQIILAKNYAQFPRAKILKKKLVDQPGAGNRSKRKFCTTAARYWFNVYIWLFRGKYISTIVAPVSTGAFFSSADPDQLLASGLNFRKFVPSLLSIFEKKSRVAAM